MQHSKPACGEPGRIIFSSSVLEVAATSGQSFGPERSRAQLSPDDLALVNTVPGVVKNKALGVEAALEQSSAGAAAEASAPPAAASPADGVQTPEVKANPPTVAPSSPEVAPAAAAASSEAPATAAPTEPAALGAEAVSTQAYSATDGPSAAPTDPR